MGTIWADSEKLQTMAQNLVIAESLYLTLELWHRRHVQILNGSTRLADEMIMAMGIGIKARMIATISQLLNFAVFTEGA
jgi:hypothetical protein